MTQRRPGAVAGSGGPDRRAGGAIPDGRGVAEPHGTVVVVHLVGGLDGLSVVVPFRDPLYARRRPSLAIAAPGERSGAIEIDRGIGLHPAFAPLWRTLGRDDRFAVICGVGVPDRHGGTSGHLPSRDFLHRGGRQLRDGWGARLLRFEGLGEEARWSAGSGPHPIFLGIDAGRGAPVPVPVGARVARAGEAGRCAVGVDAAPASAGLARAEWDSAAERLGRGYPEGRLGRALAATADLIRTDPRVRLVAIDHDGYDTHVDQGDGRAGVLAHRLDHLARALTAFWDEMDARGDRRTPVTVIVVSEFGRAIDENGSGGTEHGRGGVALALGDRVVGGVHGDLPALDRDDVWPVTVDVRRVCADAVSSHGFRPWRGAVFSDLALPNRSLGLLLSP